MHGEPAEAVERIEIRRRARGDGWSLLTDGLALWHLDDIDALSFAYWWLRERGGMVWIVDRRGFPVVSEFVPKGGHSVMAQAAGGRRE